MVPSGPFALADRDGSAECRAIAHPVARSRTETGRAVAVWTRVAAVPVAFEPPSATFVLDWKLLAALEAQDVDFATVTLAAGIASTGDAALDARLPLDEPYRLPAPTVHAIART